MIALSAPALLGKEREYLQQALDANQLSAGEFVDRFEAAFAAYVGAPYALACSSGTTALHLALLGAHVNQEDVVRVPTLTYVATANAARYCGAEVRWLDVDPDTWGAIPRGWGAHLTVHLYGVPAALPPEDETRFVVEDAAEALGATIDGRHVGTFGSVGIFSFYGNKILTCGEGGMVVTADARIAARMRFLRGQAQDPTRRYWHTAVGYNYRMTNLQAAIGLGQLECVEEHLDRRRQLWNRYAEQLDGILTWQQLLPGTTRSPWLFVGLVETPEGRDRLMAALEAAGIESRPTFPCLHTMPMYATGERLPVAEAISARGVCLPLHATLSPRAVDTVCALVRQVVREEAR